MGTPRAERLIRALASQTDAAGAAARRALGKSLEMRRNSDGTFDLRSALDGPLAGTPPVAAPRRSGKGNRAASADRDGDGARVPPSEGVAVVINRRLAPHAALPALDRLRRAPAEVARELRTAGLLAFQDDTGGCVAVTAPRRPTEKEIRAVSIPEAILAADLVRTLTPAQPGDASG